MNIEQQSKPKMATDLKEMKKSSPKLPIWKSSKNKSKFTSSLFVLPYLVMFVSFLLIPLLYGIYISFHDYGLLAADRPFIGLENYKKIFDTDSIINDIFFSGLWNTVQFVIYSVPLLVIAGLGLALLVNSLPGKIRGLFRTLYFIPYAISEHPLHSYH